MGTKAVSPNAPVRVASCLDVPRAELARMALAREEIPAFFGNANFLSWFWHYSNAVGGVTIFVRRSEAERARDALSAARAQLADILPPWTCSSCGQRVAGQWDACWQCGRIADGAPSGPSADDTETPARNAETAPWWNVSRIAALAASIVLTLLLLKHGPMLPLLLLPPVLVFLILLWQFERSPAQPPEPQAAAEVDDRCSKNLRVTRSQVSKAIVRRAWQAAVLAVLAFPPLGFYSMRLLWKLIDRDTPLSRADAWRCRAAFLLNVSAILFCLTFLWALLCVAREVLI